MGPAAPAARRLLVEAMARRYYRTRSLSDFEHVTIDGHDVALARYVFGGTARQLGTAYVELDDVAAITTAFAGYIETLADDQLAVLDLYVQHHEAEPVRAETAARLRAALAEVPSRPDSSASSSPSPSRAGAEGCRRSTCSRSGRDRPDWSRTRCCAVCTR